MFAILYYIIRNENFRMIGFFVMRKIVISY